MQDRTRGERRLVHLVNPLWDGNGGADRRTIDTWQLLAPHVDVRLWSEYAVAPAFAACPVQRVQPYRLRVPRGGNLVFVGTYFRIGHWTRLASFDRVIVVYNTDQPDRLAKNLRRLRNAGHRVDVVYTSRELRRRHGGQGAVLESPIDVERFRPTPGAVPRRPFTVGRLSRDIATKHHEEDVELWRTLARAGCRVRLMGATCLARALADVANVELLPAGAEDAASFLRSLDCFAYRTSSRWFEAYGRVVIEAMATGVAIVAGSRGGYTDHLRHGENGLLATSTAELVTHVLALANNRALAVRLGDTARRDAVDLNVRELPRRTLAVLTAGDVQSTPLSDGLVSETATRATAAS
jgi:glycosyltransferase involved in cell wall biosynthesis